MEGGDFSIHDSKKKKSPVEGDTYSVLDQIVNKGHLDILPGELHHNMKGERGNPSFSITTGMSGEGRGKKNRGSRLPRLEREHIALGDFSWGTDRGVSGTVTTHPRGGSHGQRNKGHVQKILPESKSKARRKACPLCVRAKGPCRRKGGRAGRADNG